MTLSSTTNRVSYDGDGATVAFAVTFVFWENSDLEAVLRDADGVETTWVEGTHYTLTGGAGSTGTLTVSTTPTDYTPASGEKLVIRSNLPNTQGTSLPLGGAFPSSSVEQRLDKIVRLLQQRSEELGRAIKLAVTSAFSGLEIPDPEASKFLRWNAGATALENAEVTGSGSIGVPVSLADGGTNADLSSPTAGAVPAVNSGGTALALSAWTLLSNILTAGGQQRLAKGADVASANALSLGNDGNYFDITGTTAITSIGTKGVGTLVILQFDGALTLTHNATDLILPTGANITTAAGDHAIFVEYATGDWRCIGYWRASGAALGAASAAQVAAATDTERHVTPAQAHRHPAAAKGWFQGTVSGGTLTSNKTRNCSVVRDSTGVFTVTWGDDFDGANYVLLVYPANASTGASNVLKYELTSKAAGSVVINFYNSSNAAADPTELAFVAFGVLA